MTDLEHGMVHALGRRMDLLEETVATLMKALLRYSAPLEKAVTFGDSDPPKDKP